MDLKTAEDINAACVQHMTILMCGGRLPDSLAQHSLRDLIEARDMVIRRDAMADMSLPKPSIGHFRLHCDDRILAALYVAYHGGAAHVENFSKLIPEMDRIRTGKG